MRFRIKKIIKLLFLLFLASPLSVSSFSQETGKISPYFQLQYFKDNDNQSSLKATLTYSENRMELPLPGMEINFYSDGVKKDLLASVRTDEKGIANIPVNNISKLPVNSEGQLFFVSEYKGNDTIEASTSELQVKDVQLEMTLEEMDSVKTITLKAYALMGKRNIPAAGESVMIYVPRMFSLLPVAEVTLDDNGTVSVEFPSDLPGDNEGNLKIIARFEDNPTYGTVEKSVNRKWGVPTSYSVPKTHRALWTKTPPTWMIVTLSILLAGVWGHYLFAIISLILIKIDAKPKKPKKENLLN